ncbi:MAG: SDR family NAD(P)-dependent oxidoreductase, partial [Sphingomonadaceae bacterium]
MPVALVTGAGRGIGLETARAFVGAGFEVLALDKDFSHSDLSTRQIDYDLTNLSGIPALVARLGE